MRKDKSQEGAIAIEASIALTLFMFVILTFYSFFMVFEVQSKVSNALMQAAQSLSLDPYATEKTGDSLSSSVKNAVTSLASSTAVNNDKYTSNTKWYNSSSTAASNSALSAAIEDRFYAYLTADGTRGAGNELLTLLKVYDGADGMDFGQSYVDSDGNIVLKVRYYVTYIFDCPTINLPAVEFGQTAKSYMWKEEKIN
jgi:hypothetical protein